MASPHALSGDLDSRLRGNDIGLNQSMIQKEVKAMKFNDHLLAGLFVGIVIGLHYGSTLSAFMPIFLVLGLIYLIRYVRAR